MIRGLPCWVVSTYNNESTNGASAIVLGDCVRIQDGRIGRVRAIEHGGYRVRVLRNTSKTHQFLVFKAGQLKRVTCPRGWMSPEGYRKYLRPTLTKMRERRKAKLR